MKFSKLLLALLFCLTPALAAPPRILMVVPDNFMWPEYAIPRALYLQAGFEVKVAGLTSASARPDARNLKEYTEAAPVPIDLPLDSLTPAQVTTDAYDAISFVGGNGAWSFFPNEQSHALLLDGLKKNKVVGLICASTGLLALAGNFDGQTPAVAGRRVVGYYKVEALLRQAGRVEFVAGPPRASGVAVDGNLVTGRNPQSSEAFGKAMVEAIASANSRSRERREAAAAGVNYWE